MTLALLANTAPRIVAILGANPGSAFSGSVGTGSNAVGAFPSDAEILAATLEADEWVATQGYFQSINKTLSAPFDTVSTPIRPGVAVPFHHGDISQVQVTKTVLEFTSANVDTGDDTIAVAGHGLVDGDLVTFLTLGALPTGLVAATDYYVIRVTSGSFKLATTYANAIAGTAINLTAVGSGTSFALQWQNAVKAQSADDVLAARAEGDAYVQDGAFDYLYNIDDGILYTPAEYGRVTYPLYTRTSVLQCDKNEESLIVFRAVAILAKNASPALFEYSDQKANDGIERIVKDGVYTEPEGPE